MLGPLNVEEPILDVCLFEFYVEKNPNYLDLEYFINDTVV